MARLARVVLPGHPHHITQRGNRRQSVFFRESDYADYLRLLQEWCGKEGVEIWAYCLMANHVHLIVNPGASSNLAKAIGEPHRRYTEMINHREGWKGFLWQGRFSSFPMDEAWLLRAAAYVELNPVRAGMVQAPWEYRWSSVHAHLNGTDPNQVCVEGPLLQLAGDWQEYLGRAQQQDPEDFRKHERTGRVLGSDQFIEHAEETLGRKLMKRKPGPKRTEE